MILDQSVMGCLKGLDRVGSVFCFFKAASFRYNSHTIESPHLKCTLQQFLVYSQGFVPSPQPNFRLCYHPGLPSHHPSSLHIPQALVTIHTLFL